jgi:hypothetical protein
VEAQALTVCAVPWSLEAVTALRQAEKRDTSGGTEAVEDWLHCRLYEVRCGAEVVARFALETVPRSRGVEGVIVAAAGGLPGADLVADVLPLIECEFPQEVTTMRVHTVRPGLVKKMKRQGWQVAAYVLRKDKK